MGTTLCASHAANRRPIVNESRTARSTTSPRRRRSRSPRRTCGSIRRIRLRGRRRARRTSPTSASSPDVASVCSSRFTTGATGGGTSNAQPAMRKAAIAPPAAAIPRPSCTNSGDARAPSPKHRCNRFIARPTSLPRCQISIVLAPRSTAAAPTSEHAEHDRQRDEGVHVRHRAERQSHHDQRPREQAVPVQAVERRPAAQRPDDVADRLGDEQHADRRRDPTPVRSRSSLERRPEEADREPDDQEGGEVQRRRVDGDRRRGDGVRGAPCAHYGMPHGTFAQWLVPPTRPFTTHRQHGHEPSAQRRVDSRLGARHSGAAHRGSRDCSPGSGGTSPTSSSKAPLHAVFVRSERRPRHDQRDPHRGRGRHAGRRRGVDRRRARRRAAPRVREGPRRLRPAAARRRSGPLRRRGDRGRASPRPTSRARTRRARCGPRSTRCPPIIDPETAFDDDAPLIFPDHGSNEAMIITDRSVVDLDAISDVVVRGRYVNQRMAVAPMEPDCCAAAVDAGRAAHVCGRRRRCRTGCTASSPRRSGSTRADVHVITPQVGGGFGGKAGLHPEYTVVAAAARGARTAGRVGADAQRGHAGAPAQPRPGAVRRARVPPRRHVHRAAGAARRRRRRLSRRSARSCRAAPAACRTARTTSRRSSSTSPSRSRTRPRWAPTAAPAGRRRRRSLERARRPRRARARHRPDRAARAQLPRRRRVPVHDDHRQHVRHRARTGCRCDTRGGGDRLRRAARRTGGAAATTATRRLLGIGVASYVEITAGGGGGEFGRGRGPRRRIGDRLRRHVCRTARATRPRSRCSCRPRPASRSTGSRSSTATPTACRTGGGTGGSRSLQLGGSAVHEATEAMVDKAKALAATAARGRRRRHRRRRRRGHDRRRRRAGLGADVGRARRQAPADDESPFGALGADVVLRPGRRRRSRSAPTSRSSRSTPRRARSRLLRHVAVDDCGTVLNPLLVEGQQHGGIASGVGQALYEEVRFDTDGNPITSNFADYGMPSAAELPIVRRPFDRDADAAQSARREGDRRGGDDRLDTGRAERRHRRRSPTSACATSTCRARPSGCGARCATPGPARSPTRGASRRPCSPDRPPPTPPTRPTSTPPKASESGNPVLSASDCPWRHLKQTGRGFRGYLMARALGGLATPAGRLSGADVKKHS